MFITLTRILLWGLVFYISYQAMVNWIPKPWFTVLGGLLLVSVAGIGFYNPNLEIPFEAWKIVSVPFQPLGLGLILMLIGINQVQGGSIRTPRSWYIWGGLLTILLSSMPFFANNLAYYAENSVKNVNQNWRDYTPTVVKRPEVIILLGGGTTMSFPGYGTNIQLTDTGDRIIHTAKVYEQEKKLTGRAPDIIVCAPLESNPQDPRNYVVEEAYDVADMLYRLGVSSSDIILETDGKDLRTTAVEVAKTLEELRLKDEPVYLITSALNSRRAALTFINEGVKVISTPSDYQVVKNTEETSPITQAPDLDQFIPNPGSLELTTRVVQEFVGSIYYFLRDWIQPVELG